MGLIPEQTTLFDMWVPLAALRADAELLIVQHLCASPKLASFLIDSYGVRVDHFDQIDLAGIFGAVRLHARHERIVQAESCRRVLQGLECWDPTDNRSFVSGMWWSNEKLAALFSQTVCVRAHDWRRAGGTAWTWPTKPGLPGL